MLFQLILSVFPDTWLYHTHVYFLPLYQCCCSSLSSEGPLMFWYLACWSLAKAHAIARLSVPMSLLGLLQHGSAVIWLFPCPSLLLLLWGPGITHTWSQCTRGLTCCGAGTFSDSVPKIPHLIVASRILIVHDTRITLYMWGVLGIELLTSHLQKQSACPWPC